jgi:uncharacterized protein YjbI with pentapeptide repeats
MHELTEWTWNSARAAGVLPKEWLNLHGSDLTGANLHGANLAGANLTGANLDFSAWPLWCGSLNVKCGSRLARQLAYHLCALGCDDPEFLQVREACLEFANKMHRADLPRLERKDT